MFACPNTHLEEQIMEDKILFSKLKYGLCNLHIERKQGEG